MLVARPPLLYARRDRARHFVTLDPETAQQTVDPRPHPVWL